MANVALEMAISLPYSIALPAFKDAKETAQDFADVTSLEGSFR